VKRLGILISGRGSNFEAIAANVASGAIPAEIGVVISNRPDARGLETARTLGLPAVCLPSRGLDREIYDRQLLEELDKARVDLVCLAGFMRLLTPWFVRHWEGRMINIHPALLPEFKGLDTHARALAAGASHHGATVHFVVPEMDAGPIILQDRLEVLETDDADTLAARVLAIEHRIYPEALARVARGEATIGGERR
jgi:phosphoribosylglycinamide formyltransferase-1